MTGCKKCSVEEKVIQLKKLICEKFRQIFTKTRTFSNPYIMVLTTSDQKRTAVLCLYLWICIVCQKVSSEKLRCPAKSASDQVPADVYSAFADNKKFKGLNALPVDVDYREHATVHAFVQQNASWHKCHRKFNNYVLECARRKHSRKRKSTEGGATGRSKRKPNLVNTHHFFCGGTTTLSHHMCSLPLDN